MKRVAILAVLIVGLSWSSLTSAIVSKRLGFQLKGVVQGQAQPMLVFRPTEGVKQVKVTLWRSDGDKSVHHAAAIETGAKTTIEVRQPKGKFGYKAKLDVTWTDGETSTLRIKFDLTRSDGLTMHIDPAEVDLDGRTLRFTLSTDVRRAELRIFDSQGNQIDLVKKRYAGEAAGTKLDVSWQTTKGDVAHMTLRAWNAKGFWTEMRLEPVSMRIEHRDVEFASGSAIIDKREEPKLKATLAKLKQAVQMHGQTIALRLYIAGYCDTMGPAAANRVLSAQRARAIGRWFRRHGLKIPIHYQGFGEDVLAVKTPDETAEAANRRALYLLSTHTPAKSRDIPKQDWKPL